MSLPVVNLASSSARGSVLTGKLMLPSVASSPRSPETKTALTAFSRTVTITVSFAAAAYESVTVKRNVSVPTLSGAVKDAVAVPALCTRG